MINTNFRLYDYYLYSDSNGYGQPVLSEDPQGQVRLSIFTSSQSIQDNILYKESTYIAMTHDKNIDDSYVIAYGDKKLKVLYVNKVGRFYQVFLGDM